MLKVNYGNVNKKFLTVFLRFEQKIGILYSQFDYCFLDKNAKNEARNRVVSLAENLHFDKSARIAFVWTNAKWLSPNP